MTLRLNRWLLGIAGLALLAVLGLYLPGGRALFLICKPVATIAIIALTLRLHSDEPRYRRGIVIGLVFGLIGDVLLMRNGELAFMSGLGSFLCGHVVYLHAYRQRAALFAAAWPYLLYVLLAALVLGWLWPQLPGALRIPVLVYVVLLAAQAAAVWWRQRSMATACAAVGGACFLASDAILAIDRFALPFVAAPALLLGLYWLAQTLIALSVRPSPATADGVHG